MIDTIFFDIDGTLFDYPAAEKAAARRFYRRHWKALLLSEMDFLLRWAEVTEKHFQRYLDGQISQTGQRRARLREVFGNRIDADDAALDGIFAVYMDDFEASWRLYPDVAACLARLGAYTLGIISNGHSLQQRQKLSVLKIAGHFQHIMISSDIGLAKPEAGIFHAACAMAGRPPATCLYVGDKRDVDGWAAAGAGMASVWLNRDDSVVADGLATIHALDQLHDFLLR